MELIEAGNVMCLFVSAESVVVRNEVVRLSRTAVCACGDRAFVCLMYSLPFGGLAVKFGQDVNTPVAMGNG